MTLAGEDPKPASVQPLAAAVASGVRWNASGQVARQVILLATQVILARVLFPRDFGTFALATVLMLFCCHVAEVGLPSAVLQRQTLSDAQVAAAIAGNVVLSACLALGLFVLAPALGSAFGSQSAVGPMRELSACIPLLGGTAVHRALLRRDLRFKRLALVDLVSAACSAASAVLLAAAGSGVFALVHAQVAAAGVVAVGSIGSISVQPTRPTWRALRDLARLSSAHVGYEGLTYWSRSADTLLVGRMFGSSVLGIYSRGFSLVQRPVAQLQAVVGSVAIASLAKLQDDQPRMIRAYDRVVSGVAFTALPVLACGLAFISDWVALLFGPRWSEVTPYGRLFLVAAVAQLAMVPPIWLIQATGKARTLLAIGIGFTGINFAGFAIAAASQDPRYFAATYVASAAIMAVVATHAAARVLGASSSRSLVRPLEKSLLLATVATGVASAISRLVFGVLGPWRAVVGSIVVMTTFGLLSSKFAASETRDMRAYIQHHNRRFRTR